MRKTTIGSLLAVFACGSFAAEVRVDPSVNGWTLHNDRISLELAHTSSGQIQLRSLRNLASGREWAAPQTAAGVSLEATQEGGSAGEFRFSAGEIHKLPNGGVELAISSVDARTQAKLWQSVRGFPGSTAVEFAARLENPGTATLPLLRRIAPLAISITGTGLNAYTAGPKGRHGFMVLGPLSAAKRFTDWTVLEQSGESLLIGGDMGAGILQWSLDADPQSASTRLRAGFGFRKDNKVQEQPAFEVAPGKTVETPLAFLALAKGDEDDAGNEAFRYLKRFVFPVPVPNSPLAAYCIWYTVRRSEELLRDELKFAQRIGFEVFYHDASWYEGSSLVPGTNDWSRGLGSYRESLEKFPGGMKEFSNTVRSAGMKFGLWVDPGNVDSTRVASGEIPERWLAKIDGKPLQSKHPSLSPMTQLCLGNPEVVGWLKKNLTHIIEEWHLEWMKWDPSGTVNNNCNRTDHGHAGHNGSYAAWRGKMDLWSYLTTQFPRLIGFECDPSLRYSRTNPGPVALLPGGYETEFITGPMVSPFVWGSPYTAKGELTGSWYSASALDYNLRKHFMHGFVFGNIDGMLSQRLSAAPAGYIEAFERNLQFFKQYRHLLTEDLYHPKLKAAQNWSAVEYVKGDASQAVVFVFRDAGGEPQNNMKLRGLEASATYQVTSLNQRPGRERSFSGAELASTGLDLKLPDEWMAKGDGLPDPRYQDQLTYGSDVLLLRKVSK